MSIVTEVSTASKIRLFCALQEIVEPASSLVREEMSNTLWASSDKVRRFRFFRLLPPVFLNKKPKINNVVISFSRWEKNVWNPHLKDSSSWGTPFLTQVILGVGLPPWTVHLSRNESPSWKGPTMPKPSTGTNNFCKREKNIYFLSMFFIGEICLLTSCLEEWTPIISLLLCGGLLSWRDGFCREMRGFSGGTARCGETRNGKNRISGIDWNGEGNYDGKIRLRPIIIRLCLSLSIPEVRPYFYRKPPGKWKQRESFGKLRGIDKKIPSVWDTGERAFFLSFGSQTYILHSCQYSAQTSFSRISRFALR